MPRRSRAIASVSSAHSRCKPATRVSVSAASLSATRLTGPIASRSPASWCAAAALHYLRRADLRSRHVGASNGSQSAARAEGTAGADLPLHLARSLSGGAFLRSGGDHVSRAYRRVGADRKDLCLAAPPLHARPAVGGPAPGTRTETCRPAHLGRSAERGPLARGLCLLKPVPLCRAGLCRRRACTGRRFGPSGRLPAPAGAFPGSARRLTTLRRHLFEISNPTERGFWSKPRDPRPACPTLSSPAKR